MKAAKLTNRACDAHKAPMLRGRKSFTAAMAVLGAAMAAGCVSVNAPNEPIVIELNINIKQEVLYRLADDVKSNIEANPEIF